MGALYPRIQNLFFICFCPATGCNTCAGKMDDHGYTVQTLFINNSIQRIPIKPMFLIFLFFICGQYSTQMALFFKVAL